MARKKTMQNRCDELLQKVKLWAQEGGTWVDLHNKIYGVGGLAGDLFPTEKDRLEFSRTDTFREIQAIMDSMMDAEKPVAAKMPSANGKILVRIPRSLHAALLLEAEAEGVSLNQLVLAKLACQLQNAVAS